MHQALVAEALAKAAGAGSILAIEQRDDDVRDTPMHQHPAGQLLGSLEGLLSVSTPAASWVVPATHAVWFPPGLPHALRSVGPFRGWSLYVPEEVAARSLPSTVKVLHVSGVLREVVARAAEWRGAPRDDRERRLAAVLIDEVSTLKEEPLGLPLPREARLAALAADVLADLSSERGLDSWALSAGIAPRTLARNFRAETGFSFGAWRQRARALRAVEWLDQGLPVTTIAMELGYNNVSAFIEMFKRSMGVTPGRYGTRERPQPANAFHQ